MKIQGFAILVAGFASSVTFAAAVDSKCFKAELETYERVQNDFKTGADTTSVDVAYAELNMLEAYYTCSVLTQVDYCKAARAAVADYIEGVVEESRVGRRTQRDIVDSQRLRRSVEKTCLGMPK